MAIPTDERLEELTDRLENGIKDLFASERYAEYLTAMSKFHRYSYGNAIEYMTYGYDNGRQFVIYCWNIFSTVIFVQECLKRFGEPGDQFILTYREKDEKETVAAEAEAAAQEELVQQFKGYRNPFSSMLIESKNLIFRGAPGTGKSYLAKEIAADIISNGYFDDYTLLSDEQKKQVEFVQFHPSYDYSDFVEGLRPKVNYDGTMGFELQDGIFKKFVSRARKNYEDSQKSKETVEKELTVREAMAEFFAGVELGVDTFKTINGNEFTIMSVDDSHINISIPGNATVNKLSLNLDEVRRMLESGQRFDKIKDITTFFGKSFATQAYSYDFAIYKAIKAKKSTASKVKAKQAELKKYIFIIDEINRGEISKIFGELFFAIDPGYRGRAGEISTQYSNLHSDPDEKFYIPENVYIIGTMNDIDRSVDSFDFAMRRRFRFVELRADERLEMLLDFPNIVNMETDADHNNRLFNFLLFLFPHYLQTAMRKGLFKKYIRRRYNDGNVKGTIDVARHIENNTPFVGNIAYSQREFSYDNSLMELVRHTVEFIKRKPYGNKLLVKVKDEIKQVIDATPGYEPYDRQKIIEQNKKNTVRHAYFREYLALQRLCLLILQNQRHQIGAGSRQIYGILFDGAWLWEEYINLLIGDVFYHPMNKGGKGAQRLFEGNVGLIYPDFISRNSEHRMIADAKYKPINNIGNRDYLQVLAYMFRFDAKTGYYLYPEAGDFDDLRLRMNRGSTYEANVSPRNDITIIKHGLKIPMDAPDYSCFATRMEAFEHEFRCAFSSYAVYAETDHLIN